MTNSQMRVAVCGVVLFGLFTTWESAAAVDDAKRVIPGELIVDHPTLINLGFEWPIQGDDNRNAEVDVSYRKRGEAQWKVGLPLLRLQANESIKARVCSTSSLRTCSLEAFSTWSPIPTMKLVL